MFLITLTTRPKNYTTKFVDKILSYLDHDVGTESLYCNFYHCAIWRIVRILLDQRCVGGGHSF